MAALEVERIVRELVSKNDIKQVRLHFPFYFLSRDYNNSYLMRM